jgi:hypothetical protein
MTSVTTDVHLSGTLMLAGLLAYTFWLLRSGRLTPHLAVRWILAEIAAATVLLLWPVLPMFRLTSTMGDRQLLIQVAVVFFVLISFLMLDSLSRIATHGIQIKQLTQELALLREEFERAHRDTAAQNVELPPISATQPRHWEPVEHPKWSKREIVVGCWAAVAMGFFIIERQYGSALFPEFLRDWLSANYLK